MSFLHSNKILTQDDVDNFNNNQLIKMSDEDFSIWEDSKIVSIFIFKNDGENFPLDSGVKCFINGEDDFLYIQKGSGEINIVAGYIVSILVSVAG